MSIEPLHKRDVAAILLQRAIVAYLEEKDYVSAIVLAGSCEDLCGDLITEHGMTRELPEGHSTPRAARDLLIALDLTFGAFATEKQAYDSERRLFNWLRHANNASEQMSMEADWQHEAEHRVDVAAQNFFNATGIDLQATQRWSMRERPDDEWRPDDE